MAYWKTRKKKLLITFKPTNDFVIDGLEWEMKTPEKELKYKTVSKHIRDAVEQGKDNFIINLDGKYANKKALYQLSKYNDKNPANKVKRLYTFRDGKNKLRIFY